MYKNPIKKRRQNYLILCLKSLHSTSTDDDGDDDDGITDESGPDDNGPDEIFTIFEIVLNGTESLNGYSLSFEIIKKSE